MSITSAKSGATGISLALDNNYMEPIATTVVGAGGVNTIVFNDIPQGYKHLQIRGIIKTDRSGTSDYYKLKFNSDVTNTNYSYHELKGNGTSVLTEAGANSTTQVAVERIAAGQQAASTFGATVVDILDYTNINKYKTVRYLTGFEDNSSNTGQIILGSGLWLSTVAITRLDLSPGGGTLFSQYSRISLYGIKG